MPKPNFSLNFQPQLNPYDVVEALFDDGTHLSNSPWTITDNTDSDAGPLRLRYFIRVNNIGDRINPTLISSITNKDTIWYPGIEKPHLVACGSLLSGANENSIVWGTGIMHPSFPLSGVQATNIFAVRGKLSHGALRKSGIAVGDIPLGDPGFLLQNIAKDHLKTHKKYRLGVAAHYVDRRNGFIQSILKEDGVIDLNVHYDEAAFFNAISQCEAVVSSSLHGLIFAEALGIPNLWIEVSDEVAGGGFKFHDWFSLAKNPQRFPYRLTKQDNANTLISYMSLHDICIDKSALLDAFPAKQLEALSYEPKTPAFIPAKQCRKRKIPLFVISYNRGSELLKVIDSYRNLSDEIEIIVHDNGSDNELALSALNQLEAAGTKVFRGEKIACAEDLNNVNNTIQAYFSCWGEPSRYIVTDCDIDMGIASPDTLKLYNELLDSFRKIQCVGPMLRIIDIPKEYPLYNFVMNRHISQFWHKEPEFITTSYGQVAYTLARIDTTFALHRAGEPFARLKDGMRVYHPYEAKHLDWYITEKNDENLAYFKNSSEQISHWNNESFFNQNSGANIEYDGFWYIDHDENSEPIVKRFKF
ncbi:MAG: polysaccharide pyruvyl transferase family protein [Methylococcales bacterium]|nr:polysaccharide pyruvyl transferase family protein [Methylococcales bacterium]